jgi:hypothetical protein
MLLPNPGETPEQYAARIIEHDKRRMIKDGASEAAADFLASYKGFDKPPAKRSRGRKKK